MPTTFEVFISTSALILSNIAFHHTYNECGKKVNGNNMQLGYIEWDVGIMWALV
jgi:hypothetical protein